MTMGAALGRDDKGRKRAGWHQPRLGTLRAPRRTLMCGVCETGHHRGWCSTAGRADEHEGESMANHHGTDRRVRKTRTQLHGALAALVHEKPYDDIVVKEILARADVGRSTFYAHYRDKDELLERGIRDLLCVDVPRPSGSGKSASDRLLEFSLPFLEHVERYRVHGELSFDAVRAAPVHEHLQRVLESVL